MNQIKLLIICLFASSIITLDAQNTTLQSYQDTFQLVIDQYYDDNNFPGLSASISLGENGSWQGVAGFSHDDVLMDTAFLQGVASHTKLFTSIICLKMIENGFFALDDPLGMWLPDFEHVDPAITVRQLLQHSSGLSDYINNLELIPGQIVSEPLRIWEPEEIVAQIDEPWAAPGEIVYYSNINFILAGMVLEAATNMKFVDLVRDSIIVPLGLQDLYFEGFEEITDFMAHPFLFGQDYSDVPRTALGTLTWSAGSMVSRPITINKWYNAVFNSDFLSNEVKSNLLDFIAWPDNMDGDLMGMGIYEITHNARKYYGHGGRTVGYSSFSLYDIECNHSIFVVNNEIFSDARTLALELAEKACLLTNPETSTYEVYRETLTVYPVPADDFIHISLTDPLNSRSIVQISDLSGKSLVSKMIGQSSEIQLSTAHLADGIYILNIYSEPQIISQKIIVAH